MTHEEIKKALRQKGYTLAMIADALGCSATNVQQVSKRITYSMNVAKAIATVLDKPLLEIFDDVPSYRAPSFSYKHRQQRVEALKQRLAS